MNKEDKYKNRYPIKVSINHNQENIKEAKSNYDLLIKENIERLRKIEKRAKGLTYFENILLDREARVKELKEQKAKGKKVIGIFCLQVPEEVIYAAGAIPLRLDCGYYDAISPAEEVAPKNTCPMIKADIGYNFLRMNPMFELCDVVVIPTTCDGKKKMADVLSNYAEIWTMDIPNDKDSEFAQHAWTKEIKTIKEKIERLTGNSITSKTLKASVQLLRERTILSRDLFDARNNLKISGRDTFLVMQAAFYADIYTWMAKLKELIAQLHSGELVVSADTPRIMLAGSPVVWPNMKLLHIVEESGAIIVTDDSCACGQYFYNPCEVLEWTVKAMLEAIGDKCLLPTVCPIFIHADDRIDRILELHKQYKVEGVVYHVLRLCQVFDFEFIKIEKVLEERSIPIIKIETELSLEDIGQITTRVEAFIELLEGRRT